MGPIFSHSIGLIFVYVYSFNYWKLNYDDCLIIFMSVATFKFGRTGRDLNYGAYFLSLILIGLILFFNYINNNIEKITE